MDLFSYECCNIGDDSYDAHYWKDQGYLTRDLCLTYCLRDKDCIASEILGYEDDLGKSKCYSAIVGDEDNVVRSECNTDLDKRCYTKKNKSGLYLPIYNIFRINIARFGKYFNYCNKSKHNFP